MSETEFLNELVVRTGCRLLCDISNVFVSGRTMGFDPYAYVAALPASAIDELHLGGFTPEEDEATPGGTLLIDTHAAPVAQEVWPLYRAALRRLGAVPTLIEWDNDLPTLATLLDEAAQAARHLTDVGAEARSAAR
jgi:uncharacterized protein (UPF0276 family)